MNNGYSTSPEIERKYAVDWAYVLPELSELATVREDGTASLVNTYYDTDDLLLARERVLLRRRTGGPDAGWHLKLPPADELRKGGGRGQEGVRVRTEIQVPAPDGKPTNRPPEELLGLIRALARNRSLTPQGRIRTDRRLLTLLADDGSEIAELADDRAAVISGRVITERFREVEVEDRPGAEDHADVLTAVLERLQAAGAVLSNVPSKSARAFGARALAPAEVPEPPPLSPAAPAAIAVKAHLQRYVRALRWEDVLVRLDADDSVHQLRVATRRLRSGLRAYRPLLDPEWTGPLRAELRWLAQGFAPARDAEVQLGRLVEHAVWLEEVGADEKAVTAVQAFLGRRLGEEQAVARDEGLELLDSERYLQVHEDLVIAANSPAVLPEADGLCEDVLPPLARRSWRKLERAVRKLRADDPDEVWHETRITAKRARYAAEVCAPALGGPAQALAKQLSKVTDVLGEHQDAVVAAETLTRLATAGRVPARTAYWLGVLHTHERDLALAARTTFEGVWRATNRRKLLRWLG